MTDPVALVRRYLDALEQFDRTAAADVLHPEVQQVEHPNMLTPKGNTRGKEGMLAGVEAGAKVLHWQRFEIDDALVAGERLALQMTWTAKVRVPLLGKEADAEHQARFGVFITLRDGQIYRQVNYDCFLP